MAISVGRDLKANNIRAEINFGGNNNKKKKKKSNNKNENENDNSNSNDNYNENTIALNRLKRSSNESEKIVGGLV